MALIYTPKETIQRARIYRKLLLDIVSGLRVAKREQEQIFARGGFTHEVKTAIDLKLADLDAVLTDIIADIAEFRARTVTWATVFRPGNPTQFHHFDVDVTDGAKAILTYKTITGVAFQAAGVPFSASDVIIISKAQDSSMNGAYIIEGTTSDLQIALTTILPGSDVSEDISMTLTLREG